MDKLIIGRYIVGDSFIHRLDPRSKLLAMLIYIVIIFWANNPLTYAVITLFTLFLVFLSKIKLGFFLGGIKPMIWIILYPISSFLQYKRECALVYRLFKDYGSRFKSRLDDIP